MNKIEEGVLVKAWDDDSTNYSIGEFVGVDENDTYLHFEVFMGNMDCTEWFKNVIEIPQDLAKQLEELGK